MWIAGNDRESMQRDFLVLMTCEAAEKHAERLY